MTAFVVLAFLENRRHVSARQRNAMNRGISYVAESWRETDEDSPYALALSAYVLQLADHPQKGVAFQLLDSRYGRGFFYKKNQNTNLFCRQYWESSIYSIFQNDEFPFPPQGHPRWRP